MTEFLLGFVSVCVVILSIGLWSLRRADKSAGRFEAELDKTLAAIDEIEKVKNANKKIDIERVNTPIDKRLRQVDYRD